MSDVVTGEAVALDLRHARLPSRALAVLIDVILQVAALLGLVLLAGRLLRDSDGALTAAVQLVLVVAVLVGYPVLAETVFSGRTIGKSALGLRVVRDDGGPIRFRQALVRGLLGFFVDLWLTSGIGAIVSATVSGRGKRVGDVLAGTVVIRDRTPAGSGPAPAMPPGLASWAAVADLSRVDDRLALAARQVLNRSRQLSPAAYGELCQRLATAVAAVASPPPPPGTPPDYYLGAVLAQRRNRAELRFRAGAGPKPDGTPPPRTSSRSWSPPSRLSPAPSGPAAAVPPDGSQPGSVPPESVPPEPSTAGQRPGGFAVPG